MMINISPIAPTLKPHVIPQETETKRIRFELDGLNKEFHVERRQFQWELVPFQGSFYNNFEKILPSVRAVEGAGYLVG